MGVIKEIQEDLEAGARRLFGEYHSRLLAEARSLCSDSDSAEDLVMLTLETYFAKPEKYDSSKGELMTWLKAVMRNHFRKSLRRKSHIDTIFLPADDLQVVAERLQAGEAQTEPEGTESDELIRRAVASLSPKVRDAVILHYFKGHSVDKTASALGISVEAAKNRLFCARQILHTRLKGRLGKSLAVLAALLFGVTALFGAYQLAKVEEVEKVEERGCDSASATSVVGADVLGGPQAESNDVPAVESISANEQEGTNEMKKVQVVKALAGVASAVTLAAAPLLAVAEETPKPYDAVVDYVESTGTQYIDMGFKPMQNHKFVIKFAYTDTTTGGIPFGYGAKDSKRAVYIARNLIDGVDYMGFCFDEFMHRALRVRLGAPSTAIHEVKVANGVYSLDGIEMVPRSVMTGTCLGNAYLFAMCRGWDSNTAGSFTKMRLYRCQVYNGATMVRDFCPVRVGDVGCVYERFSDTIYQTKGTGTLTAGPDSAEQTIGDLKFTNDLSKLNRRVKYVETDGATEFINTGFRHGSNCRVTFKYSMVDANASGALYGYSAADNGRSVIVKRLVEDGKAKIFVMHNESQLDAATVQEVGAVDTGVHKVEVGPTKYAFDGISFGSPTRLSGACAGPLYFGAISCDWALKGYDGNQLPTGFAKMRVYSCKAHDGDKVVHDYVPVETVFGAGLWDKVASRFHPGIRLVATSGTSTDGRFEITVKRGSATGFALILK